MPAQVMKTSLRNKNPAWASPPQPCTPGSCPDPGPQPTGPPALARGFFPHDPSSFRHRFGSSLFVMGVIHVSFEALTHILKGNSEGRISCVSLSGGMEGASFPASRALRQDLPGSGFRGAVRGLAPASEIHLVLWLLRGSGTGGSSRGWGMPRPGLCWHPGVPAARGLHPGC